MAQYHHGNLRKALLAIATDLLAEEGLHALSLRKMAQKAGVSHNAPYMHFADKEAVLVAIAEEGFRLLAIEVESAISQAGSSTREQLIRPPAKVTIQSFLVLFSPKVPPIPYPLSPIP